jgi:hypothetical protein
MMNGNKKTIPDFTVKLTAYKNCFASMGRYGVTNKVMAITTIKINGILHTL